VKINVRGKNVDVNPAFRQYAEKRLTKLDRFIKQGDLFCQVTLSSQRGKYVVEVTIPLNGLLLRAEDSAQDAFSSVDLVLDKLERQIKKYKTKLLRRDKGEIKVSDSEPKEEPAETGKIVRVKRFAIKPTMPEEAAMQMELLGHDFFVFANGETGAVNVIYRRKDGNYGLIEPEE